MIEQPFPHGKETEALEKSGEVVRRLRAIGLLMGRNQSLWEKYLEKVESRIDGFRYTGTKPEIDTWFEENKIKAKIIGATYEFESPTSPKMKNVRFSLTDKWCNISLWAFDIRDTKHGDKFSHSYIDMWTQDNGEPIMHFNQQDYIHGVRGTGEWIEIYVTKDPIAIFTRSDTKAQIKKKVPVAEALSHFIEPA